MKLIDKVKKVFKNETLPKVYDDSEWIRYLTERGHSVTRETAFKVAAAIRCADVVAKTMASLGCHLYRHVGQDNERATDYYLYEKLRFMPNKETTSYEFWHMYVLSLMLTKGAYAKIVRNGAGRVEKLINIPSNHATLMRNSVTDERYLSVVVGRQQENIYDFMYTPGIRLTDEEKPIDFLDIAADVLGLTMNLNSFANEYFVNGSNVGGFIEYPTGINEDVFYKFKEQWGKAYSSVKNAHKWALLEGGFKLHQLTNNPEEAQALESRKFQILEICRIMGVTPHKVFSLENVSYNSIEQLNIEYWQDTIHPMDERLTQTIYKDLLLPGERLLYFAKFNTNKLLKGDTKARTDYYNMMRQNGVMSANDIRRLEDMNSIPDEEGGNIYFVNGNMLPLEYAKHNKPKSLQNGG